MTTPKHNGRTLPLRKRGRKWLCDYRKLGSKFYPEGCPSGRKLYATKIEAEGAAQIALKDFDASRNTAFDFTPELRRIALNAFQELRDYNPEALIEAAKLYKEQVNPGAQRRTVNEAFAEFIASHEGAGNALKTLDGYKFHLGRLAKDLGDRYVHEITAGELERWLDGKNLGDVNRRNYRRYAVMFWRFCLVREYCRINPAAQITQGRLKRKSPGILTAGEATALMREARAYSGGSMIPYFALAAFAGIRPHELRRLNWSSIDLERGEVYIAPDVAKTGFDRIITMPDNLREWLATVRKTDRCGIIYWTRRAFDAVRKATGDEVWDRMRKTGDILRHSCASHLYAKTGSADLVTSMCGHSLAIFLRHYRATVSKDEGVAYFEIRPDIPVPNGAGSRADANNAV